ncbi:unnamed protein product [Lathyrus sativus]|nr:unnamed protein product [Lathyrus sativus]
MNIVSINIKRGVLLVKRKRVASMIQLGKVDVYFTQESKLPKLDSNLASLLWGDSNVEWSKFGIVGSTGAIFILCRKDLLKLSCSFKGEGFVGLNAEWKGRDLFFVNVFSSCALIIKRKLWRDLVATKNNFGRGDWLVGNGFNSATCSSERKGASGEGVEGRCWNSMAFIRGGKMDGLDGYG